MRRREGGREGEVIPRVWESTVATEGVLGNLNPLGDGPGRSLADHGARVPEVLPAAELEGFLTGLAIAMPREPVFGAAVGDDVPLSICRVPLVLTFCITDSTRA